MTDATGLLPVTVEALRMLGARVRLARRERRWKATELAERVGVSPTGRATWRGARGSIRHPGRSPGSLTRVAGKQVLLVERSIAPQRGTDE